MTTGEPCGSQVTEKDNVIGVREEETLMIATFCLRRNEYKLGQGEKRAHLHVVMAPAILIHGYTQFELVLWLSVTFENRKAVPSSGKTKVYSFSVTYMICSNA